MRHLLLSAIALLSLTTTAFAHGDALATAHRDWEIAALQQRHYRQVEHPARVARLRAEIRIAEARVDSLRRLTKGYEPISRFRHSRALSYTIEQTRLDLLRAEVRLRELRNLLSRVNRRHVGTQRLHALRVEAAATRLAKANAAGQEPRIEIVSH